MQAEPIAHRVHRFEKLAGQSGWALNMLAVSLPDGGLLLYSPTWLGPDTFDAVDALGDVRVLVAPNHFHYLSLARFRERYPKALAVASSAALSRLGKRGQTGLSPLSTAESLLPDGAHFVEPEGLATGEAWLSVPSEGAAGARGAGAGPTWLVCDAWFHVRRPLTGFVGLALRALGTGPGLRVGRTFGMLAVRDAAAYVGSTRAALDRDRPAVLMPSHGEPIRAEDGAAAHERARAVLDARLGA